MTELFKQVVQIAIDVTVVVIQAAMPVVAVNVEPGLQSYPCPRDTSKQ